MRILKRKILKMTSSPLNESGKKSSHLDTSKWKFEDDNLIIHKKKFVPSKRLLSSSQRNEEDSDKMHQSLINDSIEVISKDEIEQNGLHKTDSCSHLLEKHSEDRNNLVETTKIKFDFTKTLENLKKPEDQSNPYLILLNRLDEEEGIRTPSTEDKLKLAEDSLRISVQEFCSTCEGLIERNEQSETKDMNEKDIFLHPALVQESLRPKVLDSSLRPPRTVHGCKLRQKALAGTFMKNLENVERRKEAKSTKLSKQGFYLPANTWFRETTQISSLTEEELELLNSTSTQAFLKFLSERKKEPPKIIQDIQKRMREMKTQM